LPEGEMTGDTRLRLADEVTFQSLGEGQDTVVLSLASGYLYTCNETAAAFLAAVDGQRTLDEMTQLLREQFDVPVETLRADLSALAEEMCREKLLIPSDD
jgi:hypothetical protein